MFCTECGFKNSDGAKFCQNCGNKTSTESSSPTSQGQLPSARIAPFIPPPPMRVTSRPTAVTDVPPQASALPACEGDSRRWHNCIGTMEYPDGSQYVGEYQDGIWNGKGTYTFPTGANYVGEFSNGQYHGQGTYTSALGQISSGKWANDRLVEAKPKQADPSPKTGWPFA